MKSLVKSIGKIIGTLLWIGSGLLMLGFWLSALNSWFGMPGVILGFILTPGVVIFPVVFWIVEGIFPAFYFIVWGIGVVGLLISGLCSKD